MKAFVETTYVDVEDDCFQYYLISVLFWKQGYSFILIVVQFM